MRVGKLNNAVLSELILSKFKRSRTEVICSPQVGADCAAVDFGGKIAVFSTDPITAANSNIGRLTVYVSCNDAAAAGAEPIGLLVTILAPPGTTEQELSALADSIAEAASEANIDIIGGHTEITAAVTRIVTSATVVARTIGDMPIQSSSGINVGDSLVITKHAGIEGMSIIANDHYERIADIITEDERKELLTWSSCISVIPEGRFAAIHGATGMHDVTEGGVLGAIWEMSFSAGLGAMVDIDAIPVHELTRRVCTKLNINPYRLISSGCMLISCSDGDKMVAGLRSIGIEAALIGHIVPSGITLSNGLTIESPEADEIYKL